MKKKITAIFVLILFVAVAMLTGCAKDKNDRIIVAKIDGENVTKSEYIESWVNVKDNYGITQDILDNPEHTEQLDDLRKNVLESVVSQKITKMELENLGFYELSQEEHNTVKSQVDVFMENVLASKQSEMMTELGEDYTEKDYVKAVNKYTQLALEENGFDEEFIKDYYTQELVMEKAENELIDLTVTDEDLSELFNQRVEADKEEFADLAVYEYYTTQGGYTPHYVPEGLRMVRHVLIAFSDETMSKIQELRTAGSDDEADKLIETELESIYDEAIGVLNDLNAGTITFDTAILNFNDDPGMEQSPDGYQMSLDSASYVQEFTDAGMALKKIGDISELVATDFGYHILEYASDVESGPIDFETVKDTLLEEALAGKQEEGWIALVDEWSAKYEIEYFYENLIEVPEETEEPLEKQ